MNYDSQRVRTYFDLVIKYLASQISEQASSTLTDLEVALYTCPGLVVTGEHLIAVARKL